MILEDSEYSDLLYNGFYNLILNNDFQLPNPYDDNEEEEDGDLDNILCRVSIYPEEIAVYLLGKYPQETRSLVEEIIELMQSFMFVVSSDGEHNTLILYSSLEESVHFYNTLLRIAIGNNRGPDIFYYTQYDNFKPADAGNISEEESTATRIIDYGNVPVNRVFIYAKKCTISGAVYTALRNMGCSIIGDYAIIITMEGKTYYASPVMLVTEMNRNDGRSPYLLNDFATIQSYQSYYDKILTSYMEQT